MTMFQDRELKILLLKQLNKFFDLDTLLPENESLQGIPSDYAYSLFDNDLLNPALLMNKLFVPVFTEFAVEALTFLKQSSYEKSIKAHAWLQKDNLTGEPQNVLECFYDFCCVADRFNRKGFGYESEAFGTLFSVVESHDQIKPFLSPFVSAVHGFSLVLKDTPDNKITDSHRSVKTMQHGLSALAEGLSVAAYIPSDAAQNVNPAKRLDIIWKFDKLLKFYMKSLNDFKIWQSQGK